MTQTGYNLQYTVIDKSWRQVLLGSVIVYFFLKLMEIILYCQTMLNKWLSYVKHTGVCYGLLFNTNVVIFYKLFCTYLPQGNISI